MIQSNQNFKWINYVKSILDSTGNSILWLNQNNIQAKCINKLVKQTLIDQYKQEWFSQLENSHKGRLYGSFKNSFNLEYYLNILPHPLRLSLLHFRTANHRFPVETGRWNQSFKPHEQRKCQKCNSGDIGDEMHYLLICPFFRTKRRQLIPERFYIRPNILKFKELLNTNDSQTLTNLSLYVKYIMKKIND
jgi:hypothetical protein